MTFSMTTFLISSGASQPIFAEDAAFLAAAQKSSEGKEGYTINFSNISIKEYIKFISKIADLNFIYDEGDLNFNVTIVSEEPTSLTNILSALIQVLKIHGLSLIDDGINLVINRAPQSPQIATLFSESSPLHEGKTPALITALFKIKNGNPTSILNILQSLLSQSAMIELSRETRHLIITDSASNIQKASELLLTLDAPHSPLEIGIFTAKNGQSHNLVTLAMQIVMPLSEGNPLILVPQPSNNSIFIVSTPYLIEKTTAVLKDLDSSSSGKEERILTADNILLYSLQYKSADIIEKGLWQMSKDLEEMGYSSEGIVAAFKNVKYIPETNSLLFTGDALALKKLQDLLAGIDVPGRSNRMVNTSFYLFKPETKTLHEFAEIVSQFASNLEASSFADQNLIMSLKSLKVIPSVESILFTADDSVMKEIQSLVKTLDVPNEKALQMLNEKFLLYPLKNCTHEHMARSLSGVADNLEAAKYPNRDLINAIDSMQWIKETNSMFFIGSDKALKSLEEMLPTFDISSDTSLDMTEFFMYTPINLEGSALIASIEVLSDNLEESGLANPLLIRTLKNARWVPSSKVVVFTGSPETLSRVKNLMPTVDRTTISSEKTAVFVYRPFNISLDDLMAALENLADNLPKEDDLYVMLQTAKGAQDSQSVVFKGTPEATAKLQEILKILDTPEQAKLASSNATYFIYKLKETSGDIVISDLEKIVKNLKSSGLDDKEFSAAVASIEWIRSTNSLYVAGSAEALKKIKDLFEEFDAKTQGQVPSEYLIYSPINFSAKDFMGRLSSIEKGLQSSGLSNPELLTCLSSVQFVEANQTLVFTGTKQAITNLKEILATIEGEKEGGPIQEVGKKTYFIYKLKYLTGPQLIGYLRSVASDISSARAEESFLLSAIDSGRFIPETQSVIFTGTQSSLEELQKIIEKFDIASLAPQVSVTPPAAYIVYQPLHLPAAELITILHDFEKQVMNSGLHEPDLFNTINNLKFLEKTGSITVSGTESSVKQVEDLLKKFDLPKAGEAQESASTINSLQSDVSFLIYKLKYHQGSEIEDALKKIALELKKTSDDAGRSNNLVQAIESIQWIQVTNSLIGTGTPTSLTKLKNLIENVDTPLQQIFIEVLVIETDLVSALDFGLRWGGQGNYKNKLGYSTGAFPNYPNSSDPLGSFNTTLQGVNATTTPTGSSLPFSSGFGLGVIGDLIYHKGQSYTALGSLIDCLRQDGDTTIILSQKVIAQDNQPATVFTGDNIPFTGSTVQNVSSNATVFSTNLEYKDIGVSLSLTPRVGDDGLITININQEISEDLSSSSSQGTAAMSGSPTAGSVTNPNVYGITTSKTAMQTQATIPDKHFLVFSGMMRNQKVKTRTGIPCLGGLPVIGAAFSSTNIQTVKKNVIIFVRPEIIESVKTYKNVTERQEDLFRSQANTEDFDQGLEMVKTPDDE